jgi:hypothetical protein
LLFGRIPAIHKSLADALGGAYKQIVQHLAYSPDQVEKILQAAEVEADSESLYEFIQRGEFDVRAGESEGLIHSIGASIEVGLIIGRLDWFVAHSDSPDTFLTSDYPVIIYPPKEPLPRWMGIGFLTPGTVKQIPLHKEIALWATDPSQSPEIRHLSIPSDQVHNANLATAARCERFLIASSKRQLTDIVAETGIDRTRPSPRFSVG